MIFMCISNIFYDVEIDTYTHTELVGFFFFLIVQASCFEMYLVILL